MGKRRYAAAIGATVALFAVATPASAAEAVQCGDTITSSVTLTADLTCDGTGLVIGADNVVVDLGGHTVQGKPALAATSVRDTTVRNGSLNGSIRDTVVLTGTDRTRFADVRINSLAAVSAKQVQLTRSTLGNRFAEHRLSTGSTLTFTDSVVQSWILDCSDNARCDFRDTKATSEYLWLDRSLVVGGDLYANAFSGQDLDVRKAKIGAFRLGGKKLRITDSETDGFELYVSSLTFLRNRVTSGPWIGVHQIDDGVIKDNTFQNARHGLFLDAKQIAGPVRIEGNTFTRNREDGLHVQAPAGSNVLVKNNHAIGNGAFGIWAENVRDGGGNTSVDNPSGCFGVVCS